MDFSRSVFLAVLVLCLVGAGCVSPNSSEISTSTESLREDTTTDEQTPQLVANNSAKKRALSAEEDYIFNQLQNASCASGAPGGQTGTKYAEIINETNRGKYVEVNVPYHYSTKELEADYESKALYLIDGANIMRVNGDEITPC
ncbi:hypothetical protein G9463_07405 [Haloarcula sp. JP-Z28]|uniref:hypothetical protein n=1 Tax=Haloarcula TaxID=2237 RepID=UPI0011E5C9B6|nr:MULTISPECIES: hypothetical protein [Haloarcula]NHN63132.1 hypothetical protein [Haloarcula sp. JP-Z28]